MYHYMMFSLTSTLGIAALGCAGWWRWLVDERYSALVDVQISLTSILLFAALM